MILTSILFSVYRRSKHAYNYAFVKTKDMDNYNASSAT